MGTGNHDEDGYLGYFCKAGDGVVDVQLISDLHKSEVFKVGAELGVPESILQSPPSADLWDGQTDEEELGVSYDFVELYTGWYLKQSEEKQKAFVNSMDEETIKEWIHYRDICENVHRRNAHKLNGPMNLNVLWIVCNETETQLLSRVHNHNEEDNDDNDSGNHSIQLQLLLQFLTLQFLSI